MAEVLAPAGNTQALTAAVYAGSDAVYLGLSDFNARRNAENFTADTLAETISFCHARKVKVYITINTLVSDDEIQRALDTAKCACTCGADAFIVADTGLAALMRRCCPSMPLHASTQMAVRTLYAYKELAAAGFSRAVLPRESSEKDIKEICAKKPLDTELFVHGAHCMSVSGQCYLSAMIGSRSGNRGLCAQPCRLPFSASGNKEKYDLSLKDLSLIPHLRELSQAGVDSFKIEGRMKRPEYVAAAVNACRRSLDGTLDNSTLDELADVFSRSGTSSGYFDGKRDSSMFGTRTKDDVAATTRTLSSVHELYRRETPHRDVSFELYAHENEPVVLKALCDGCSVTVKGPSAQSAKSKPMTAEKFSELLSKTGGTPFETQNITSDISDNVFAPSSVINELRRQALGKIEHMLSDSAPVRFSECRKVLDAHTAKDFVSYLSFEKAETVPDDLDRKYYVSLPLDSDISDFVSIASRFDHAGVKFPRVIPLDDHELREKLLAVKKSGVTFGLCATLDSLYLCKSAGIDAVALPTCNIFNSYALEQYSEFGFSSAFVSFELKADQINAMRGSMPRGIVSYGYLPLMLFSVCPVKNELTCADCKGESSLTDRTGASFRVLCSGNYSELLNSRPLWMADRLKELKNIDMQLLYFTTETKYEANDIIHAYENEESPRFEHTRGLYYRGVL